MYWENYEESRIRRRIHIDGERVFKAGTAVINRWESSRKWRAAWSKTNCGHALPQEVIHLHTYSAQADIGGSAGRRTDRGLLRGVINHKDIHRSQQSQYHSILHSRSIRLSYRPDQKRERNSANDATTSTETHCIHLHVSRKLLLQSANALVLKDRQGGDRPLKWLPYWSATQDLQSVP